MLADPMLKQLQAGVPTTYRLYSPPSYPENQQENIMILLLFAALGRTGLQPFESHHWTVSVLADMMWPLNRTSAPSTVAVHLSAAPGQFDFYVAESKWSSG